MRKKVNLLEGPIFLSLSRLALPIMAASLIQMAYNLTDMLWIGRIGSDAVAAVGSAGMYPWFANGFALIARMGGQVKTGYALGARKEDEAVQFVQTSLQLGICMGIVYACIALIFAPSLIGFFRLNSVRVVSDAKIYLRLTSVGVVFSFVNTIFSGLLTAMGNSRISFRATAIGLLTNILTDPILIFGAGPIPGMGAAGAAIATVFAQVFVTVVFVRYICKEEQLFYKVDLFGLPEKYYLLDIIRTGFPPGVQTMLAAGISMVMARMIAGFGDGAVAAQKIGVQIESISWMAAEGFGTSVNAFMAQNSGAGNRSRIIMGCRISMVLTLIWGGVCTWILTAYPAKIFRLFISEADVLALGIDYLQILGISQLFMCVELTLAGAFAGLGKTVPPSVTSGILVAARIPLAYVLMRTPLGLDGIWWSLTISGILKGVVLAIWFGAYFRKNYIRAGADGLPHGSGMSVPPAA